ncbi:T9SS type A sorting domain-containing protein [Vicingaceae bacterium]|nr:T9SS type A sorting domain-containing protein [Vicingaceae bacterium]
MRVTLFTFFCLLFISSSAQDFLIVPTSQPNQFEQLIPSIDKSELIDSMIYLFTPRDVPFKDDFSRNQLKKLNAKATDPGVFDTTFYRLYLGNQLVDTALRFTNFPTKQFRFNADSTAIDTIDNPSVQLTVVNYSIYPTQQEVVTAYPAYNIFDTVGKPVDTIASSFLYQQDSIVRYVVPSDNRSLWQNDYVLINNDYAWQPPSYGVATFDGLNREGRAYDNKSINTYGVTDYLTSVPFNIGYLFESDSVYLSFYYQPQGLGRDAPESQDSLVVEFFDPLSLKWDFAWGARGFAKAPFQIVLLKLTDKYLQNGFQFRFKSKGNRSGAYDTWNIDYVKLDKDRSVFDTAVVDITIATTITSMIKEYTSIPFWQYDAFSSVVTRDTVPISIQNNALSTRTVYFRYFVKDPLDNYYPNFPFPSDINTSTVIGKGGRQDRNLPLLDSPVSFEYPSVDLDTANSFITQFITQGSNIGTLDEYPQNDTLFFEQRFDHYFSYDNGSAEAGYGVNITDTTFGKRAMIAQEFSTFVKDTLNAISFYFLPQGVDLEGQKFNLCVWKDLTPNGLIYRKSVQDQVYYGAKNGFLTYLLDSSIVVSGKFYVGFEQSGLRSLNVGYDFKNNQKDKLFYSLNSGESFQATSAAINPGNAMIRPYFKVNNNQVAISKQTLEEISFVVYPNPSSGLITIQINTSLSQENQAYSVFDVKGREVYSGKLLGNREVVNLGDFNNGLYLIRLISDNGSVKTKRIIISH